MRTLWKKSILIISIVIGGLGFVNKTSAQFASLPFSNILSWYQQYSSVYYHFGGNNFAGMIFIFGSTIIPEGENIYINWDTKSLKCFYKLNGFYYNNLRGRRLRPLDTSNLNTLIGYDSSYTNLSLNWGLYTHCTGANSKENEIYGQITHIWGGITYSIIAWLKVNTGTNSLIQPAILSGSLGINSWSVVGLLYDTYWWIGELSTIQLISGTGTSTVGTSQWSVSAQCNDFHITNISGNNVSLSCTGTNVNGYTINLFETSWGQLTFSTWGLITPYTTTINIPTGNYLASCNVNIGNNQCNPIAISNLSGEIFASILGTGQIIPNISMKNNISPIRNADIKTSYVSEEIIVNGLTAPTLATINKWYLIINGTGVWTSGYVKNGDVVQIELISSTYYNTTVSSSIFIGWMFGRFSVITKKNNDKECDLNKTEKYKIAQTFLLLKDSYSSSSSKRINMIYVLQSMTEDIKEFDYNCSLAYLTDLIEQEIEEGDTVDETEHIAPNCKTYSIEFNEDKNAYTSGKFKKKQYFISREMLIRFIDAQNPGDCHVNIYTDEEFEYKDTDDTHVAPNGKIYTIKEDDDWYFSSPTISGIKKFDNIDELIEYIDKNNPEFTIRDHEIDKDWTPITYAAPNNKEYKIYKTNQGYMSYKLLNVKYFESLSSLQTFLDKNNPSQ